MNKDRPTDRTEDLAKLANADAPAGVRALAEQVVDASILTHASKRVRDRLFRTDLEFRKGRRRGLTPRELADASNEFATLLGAPGYARTSEEQVQTVRRLHRQLVPHLGAEKGQPRLLSDEMSPIEAFDVAASLATQKLYNPWYRVTPEEWSARRRAGRSDTSPRSAIGGATLTLMPPDTATVSLALEQGLADDSSDITLVIHQFLDRIGFQR